MNSAHPLGGRKDATKVEKPKRPQIQANMSEGDWLFFENKWTRYVRQSGITGQQLLDEIWACLDSDLERLAFQDGMEENDPEKLLAAVKTLAVTTVHPALHVVSLHEMRQMPDETVKAFSARVRGVAKNCNLTKQCSKQNCSETISFTEETCYHVVLAGIHNEELREKILSQAMVGSVKNMSTLLEYAAAEEAAKQKSPPRTVSAMSPKTTAKIQTNRKCLGCNQPIHGPFNKRRVRECRAYGKRCDKCGKNNHFTHLCKSTSIATINTDTDGKDDQDDSVVSGFITGIMPSFKISSPEDALPVISALRTKTDSNVNILPVPHFEFDKTHQKWLKQAGAELGQAQPKLR